MSTAPTLRDDVQEMITRMTDVEKGLAAKLADNKDWTRDERVQCIDAFDSAIELGRIVLPYIPRHVVRGSQNVGAGHAPGRLRPDIPGPANQLYTVHIKVVRASGHELVTVPNTRYIEENADQVMVYGDTLLEASFHAGDVWGYWFDASQPALGNKGFTWRFQWKDSAGGRPSPDELIIENVRYAGDRWHLDKMLGGGADQREQSIGYLRTDCVEQINRIA